MEKQKEKEAAKEIEKKTGLDPVVLAAVGSVLLSWYQFYVRGNKEHGLFIGLWPPTLLAFSNSLRLKDITQKVEGRATKLVDRLM